MVRLLLVDDEREILDWLFELFRELPDMDLDVYRALSGAEALDILNRTKIDVVVSDIKMPGMNGMQLLEKIRARWPLCRVVFLTGYNEFDYVYTAIKYEGVRYLLKTEEDEAIVLAVRQAVEELERSAQNREMMERVQQYMDLALPSIQRDVIKHILLEPDGAAFSTQERLDDMKLPLRRDRPVYLAAGRFDRMPPDAAPSFGVRMAASLRMRAEELFGGNFTHVNLIHQSTIDLVWLLQPAVGGEAETGCANYVSGVLEALQDYSREALRLPASFAYSTRASRWEEIEGDFATLSRLLNMGSGMGGELLLNEKNFESLSAHAALRADAALPARVCVCLKSMPALLERGDRDAFLPLLDEAAGHLRGLHGRNNGAALELYCTAATMLLAHINRRNLSEKLGGRMDLCRLTRADEHAGWADAADYLSGVARAVFEAVQGAQEKNVRESVERIQGYVRDHLGEDLSLMKLAEIFYFNPSYLSRLFKQATGQNITDYISSLRVDRARELLADHGRKIGDISAALGYESQHYFSRFFKKNTGLTPQEYREGLAKK